MYVYSSISRIKIKAIMRQIHAKESIRIYQIFFSLALRGTYINIYHWISNGIFKIRVKNRIQAPDPRTGEASFQLWKTSTKRSPGEASEKF